MVALAEKLPGSLEKLHLDLKYCKKVGDSGVAALGKHLPASLTDLSLLFGDCELIYDAGIVALAEGLPKSVEWLEINLWRCKSVGDTAVFYIAKFFPPACKVLLLTVDGTKVTSEKRSFCMGVEGMKRCTPSRLDLLAPPSQPDRKRHNDSRIGFLRRHGPRVPEVDLLLTKPDPELQPVNNRLLLKLDTMYNSRYGGSFMSKTGSSSTLKTSPGRTSPNSTMTGGMTKSSSAPGLIRKQPPMGAKMQMF